MTVCLVADASSSAPELLQQAINWPFVPILERIGMALAVGFFIGLERERAQSRGVRTFALTGLLGCLGGLMGPIFAGAVLGFTAITIVLMNYREMKLAQKLTLTTSTSLALVTLIGILFGQGHTFTPAVAGIITAGLLSLKSWTSKFALGLSEAELRAAILLAILSFVIFPVLPNHPVDPWGLIAPRENWASVIIIAMIGFINYIMLRVYGPKGMEITAFFGGLVNSRKIIVELALRLKQIGGFVLPTVYRGIILATISMLLRNTLIVAIFAPSALALSAIPFASMLIVGIFFWWRAPKLAQEAQREALALQSPFQLSAALKFGLVFLALNIIGALANRQFGSASFYFVSVAGGLLSSASSITSAATLVAHKEISASVGAIGIVLSSLTSILANLPLVQGMMSEKDVRRRICCVFGAMAVAGLASMSLRELFLHYAW